MRNSYKKDGELSETAIHLGVMEWVRLHPTISPFVIHIPNESPRTPRYGNRLKRMGMRKGVSDLFIALPRGGYHGAWIEIKTKKGRLTPDQKIFLKEMEEVSYYAKVAYGIDETLETVRHYLLFK